MCSRCFVCFVLFTCTRWCICFVLFTCYRGVTSVGKYGIGQVVSLRGIHQLACQGEGERRERARGGKRGSERMGSGAGEREGE
jgi:hypothetical protein